MLMGHFNTAKEDFLFELVYEQYAHDSEEDFPVVPLRVYENIHARMNPRTIRLWPRWVAAASVVLVVMLGAYFYDRANKGDQQVDVAALNDIAPGKEGATLTLADGRKILIADALSGQIAEQAGVRISKTADGEITYEVLADDNNVLAYNTLSTSRGEQTRLRLPDGTLVFLNAESSLRYPTSFSGTGKRAVFLSGEGYFEVAKDKARPFEVSTAGQLVQVLGTHFNINAYEGASDIRTTLLEGSVKVASARGMQSKILKPGEQSRLNGEALAVVPVEAQDAVSWKQGVFKYDGETLENIMRDVSRWYDVEVEFAEPSLKQESIYITANRFDYCG